jgi:transaldolase
VMTIPQPWLARFDASGIEPASRIDVPVDAAFVDELLARIPDFGRAYEPDGLAIDEFDGYGATVRTLRTFIESYHALIGAVREVMLPNPDVRPA